MLYLCQLSRKLQNIKAKLLMKWVFHSLKYCLPKKKLKSAKPLLYKCSSISHPFVTAFVKPCCFPGLFPAVLNLATMADINSNATCGSSGPEMFCKLVEHVPGQPVRNPQCRICNQKSANSFGKNESHPNQIYTRLQKLIMPDLLAGAWWPDVNLLFCVTW